MKQLLIIRSRCCPRLLVVAAICFGTSSSRVAAGEPSWPQFLGPDRNGISVEKGLLDEWPSGGPREVWRADGGVGMSGLAIDRGRLVTLIQTRGKQRVIALSADTGESVWQTAVAPEYKNSMGPGPRATPTISGDAVYVFTGEGILAALSFSDGGLLWSRNAVKEHGGKPVEFGMACSPLIVGDQIVVTLGAPEATLAAYHAKSGELVWKAGIDPAGYSSPALLQAGGRKQIVAFTGSSALGLEPESGKVLWRYPYETDFDCNIATPIVFQDKVFISSGENHGCALLSLTADSGGFRVEEVWSSQGRKSVMRNEWQTSILLDGYLYGLDNVGSAGSITHLSCVDAGTGERVWWKKRYGKGNFIAADGKLFMSTMKGELVVLRASPEGFDEIGRETILEATRQAPALAGGLLYLRDDREIVCVDVRGTAGQK